MPSHRRPAAAALAAGLLAACAEPAPVADLVIAPSPAAAGAAEPNLAVSPTGRVYLSWIEPGDSGEHALRFATLDGDTWSAPRTIAQGAGWFVNWADFPALQPLDDRRLTAHYLARSGASRYAYDVRVVRSADGGASWSDPLTPHTDSTASEHGFVTMWPAGGGRTGLAWLDGRKYPAAEARRAAGDSSAVPEMTLRAATIAHDGTLGDEAELDGRVCDCCQTAVALTADGPVAVYRNRSDTEVRDIYITRFVQGAWTAGQPVANDGWTINACPVNGPAVAARDRTVWVAWFTGADSTRRVFAARSDDAGATFGARIRVDDGIPAGRVGIILDDAGEALVSWLEETGEAGEVRVRRVHADGSTGASLRVAGTLANRPAGFPRMVRSGPRVVFAWTVPPSDSTRSSIHTALARLP